MPHGVAFSLLSCSRCLSAARTSISEQRFYSMVVTTWALCIHCNTLAVNWAGVDAVFDNWAGHVGGKGFKAFSIKLSCHSEDELLETVSSSAVMSLLHHVELSFSTDYQLNECFAGASAMIGESRWGRQRG